MMMRLKKNNFNIPYSLDMLLNTKSDNNESFIEKPSSVPAKIIIPKFTQPGNKIMIASNIQEAKIERKKEEDKAKKENKKEYKEEIKKSCSLKTKETKIFVYDDVNVSVDDEQTVRTIENVVFEKINENSKEISDTDFIHYLIQEMFRNQNGYNSINNYIPGFNHVPKSIQTSTNIEIYNPQIDEFYEASKKLSDVLINAVNKTIDVNNFDNDLLYVKDSIYASILVDCSSSFNVSQKAALVTLAMALGNSLTAIKIPYSIVLFCESNFQFILKQVDESNDLIHFEKLLETIVIRRRMSDMASAILMSDVEVKSKDKNRIFHSMFVLTDGLTSKINLKNQWKTKVFNNQRRSIMFYFLDILTNQADQKRVHEKWDDFKEITENTRNSVIYSKSTSIYNGDEIFVDPFLKTLTNFIWENEPDNKLIPPILSLPIVLSNEILNNVIDKIKKGVIQNQTFFAQCSFPKEILDKFTELDLCTLELKPLELFMSSIENAKPESIIKFFKNLVSISSSFFDSSIIQEIRTLVFPPNLPSQYTPSENGNVFYFPGLMKYFLTQGQDTKIFLEKKAGLIRSYSVFVVIDTSITCFNESTYTHSFQTIYSLLYPLSKIDIPSLNIILATSEGPIVLCSEKTTMMALDASSPLWVSLFSFLSRPHDIHSHFISALMAAYQMRIQQKSQSSVLFVITDGCYGFKERDEFNTIFESLKGINTIPITIGIGMNPSNIKLMSEKAIWAQNAKYIWRAILFLFGKEVNYSNTIETCFSNSTFTQSAALQLGKKLAKLNKVIPDLFNELNHVERLVATYRNYYNQDQSNNNSINIADLNKKESEMSISSNSTEFIDLKRNASGAQFDLGKKDYYKGVKILIVLCWDYTCSVNENRFVSENTLINGVENGISVIKALKYFGIETKIVKSYRDSINEMCSGLYSQVWVVCGRMDGVMPGNNGQQTNEASLIDQFIECVNDYWRNGGGLTFWTDNYPLTAEVNKFLEKAKFKYKDLSSSQVKEKYVNFHLGGVYSGGKYLKRTNSLSTCTFEGNSISKADGYEKELFNHELNTIFEGITISSAINGREKVDEWKNYKNMKLQLATEQDIFPFKPFSISSDNGFSSLYYIAPLDCNNGDIVIDCGFSKLFFELTEEGIDRYVKNIAVWMLQLEKKDIKYGLTKDPRLVTPPKFNFIIQPSPINFAFHKFKEKSKVDLVFLMDGTGSMRYFIEAARDCCVEISKKCHEEFPGRVFRFGAVVYRDTVVTNANPFNKRKDVVDKCSLDGNSEEIRDFFDKQKAYGGGLDGPEDWVSGYKCLLNEINWKEDSIKIVIHICDACGHGTSFTADQRFAKFYYKIPWFSDKKNIKEDEQVYKKIQDDQDKEFKELIIKAAQKGIIFYCLNYHKKAMYCFKKTRKFYLDNGGKKFVIKNIFKDNHDDDDNEYNDFDDDDDDSDNNDDKEDNFKVKLVNQIIENVMNAVDDAVAVGNQGQSNYEVECMEKFKKDYKETKRKFKMMQNRSVENHIRLLRRRDRGRGRRGRGRGTDRGSE